MKRWYDYTDEELLEIHNDADAFAKLLDLECAYEGAPLMPVEPGPKPESCPTQFDVTLYSVGSILVNNSEDAAKLLEFVSKLHIFKSDYNSGDYIAKLLVPGSYGYPEISTTQVYSQVAYNQIAPTLKEQKLVMSMWEAKNSDFNDAQKARKEVVSDIYEKIEEITDRNHRISCLNTEYNRYLELADGDRTTALTFLANAKPDYKEEFPKFFGEDSK